MRNFLFVLFFLSVSFISCKDCIECRYSTLKGTQGEKFCSSTKSDREAFQERMELEASQNNSKAICTKEGY